MHIIFGILSLFPVHSSGWGIHGHRIVAYVAQGLLSDHSLDQVGHLLGDESLAEIATWADEVDHTPAYAWSKCMHYIDASGDTCAVTLSGDCASGCCILSAIANYTSRLGNSDGLYDVPAQTEALKFLVHLMGDLHQPLHAGNKANQGGNALHVILEFGQELVGAREANLHSVWDTLMIEYHLHKASSSWEAYAVDMVEKVKSGHYDYLNPLHGDCADVVGTMTCLTSAADESAEDACAVAYVTEDGVEISDGTILTHAYYTSRILTVEERLAMAGMRLGALLNEILTISSNNTNYIVQVI